MNPELSLGINDLYLTSSHSEVCNSSHPHKEAPNVTMIRRKVKRICLKLNDQFPEKVECKKVKVNKKGENVNYTYERDSSPVVYIHPF